MATVPLSPFSLSLLFSCNRPKNELTLVVLVTQVSYTDNHAMSRYSFKVGNNFANKSFPGFPNSYLNHLTQKPQCLQSQRIPNPTPLFKTNRAPLQGVQS